MFDDRGSGRGVEQSTRSVAFSVSLVDDVGAALPFESAE